MRSGVFYEHQLPRPWGPDDEHRLLKDALEQVELRIAGSWVGGPDKERVAGLADVRRPPKLGESGGKLNLRSG